MLNARQFTAIATGCFLVGACSLFSNPPPPRVPLVELHRSAAQHLILRNDTGQEFTIERADGGAPAQNFAPAGEFRASLTVASVAPLEDPKDLPWQTISSGGASNHVVPPVSPFLKTVGLAVEIGLRRADGTLRPISVTLQGCMPDWSDKAADAATFRVPLSLVMRKPAGTALRLCPGGIAN